MENFNPPKVSSTVIFGLIHNNNLYAAVMAICNYKSASKCTDNDPDIIKQDTLELIWSRVNFLTLIRHWSNIV